MKKILVAILIVAMVATMAIPSFASTETVLSENFADVAALTAFNGFGWIDGLTGVTFETITHTDDGSGSLGVDGEGTSTQNGHVTAIVPMTAGVEYTITAYAYCFANSNGNWFGMYINLPKHASWAKHPAGQFPAGDAVDGTLLMQWQELSFTYTPTADDLSTVEDGQSAEFGGLDVGTTFSYISFINWGSNATVCYDDLTITYENNNPTGDSLAAVVAVFAVAVAASVVFTKKKEYKI